MGKEDLDASGNEGWKDVLQLLKEQNEKMDKLARALSVIQKSMLRNNPRFAKDSVNEAAEVMGGMLNTHRCLLESGVELQKRLETDPASKKMGIFRRPRSASLGDTPKPHSKDEKMAAPSPPQERTPKRGMVSPSPSYAQVAKSQAPIKEGDWQVVAKKKKNKEKERIECGEKGEGTCSRSTGYKRQEDFEAPLARQVGRRLQGVGEGRPVLRRHLEGNEGESRPPESRT